MAYFQDNCGTEPDAQLKGTEFIPSSKDVETFLSPETKESCVVYLVLEVLKWILSEL